MSWRTAPLPPDWPLRRARVLARDGGQCLIRGPGCLVWATDVDHVVPAAEGGGDEDDNLQSACSVCHKSKTGREAQAARVKRKRDPEPHPGIVAP